MKRIFLISLLGLIGVVLLAAVSLGIFLAKFDPNAYKEQLNAMAEKALGRQVHFYSDMRISFFPVIGLTTGKVAIRDPAGFGEEPFLEVENVSLSVSFKSLMDGILDVTELKLHKPRLKLATNTAGKNNWDYGLMGSPSIKPEKVLSARLSVPLPKTEDSQAAQTAKKASRPMTVTIHKVICSDTAVMYRNMRKGQSLTGGVDGFTLNSVEYDSPVPIALKGHLDDEQSGQKIFLKLDADFTVSRSGSVHGDLASFVMTSQMPGMAPITLSTQGKVRYDSEKRFMEFSAMRGTLDVSTAEDSWENGSEFPVTVNIKDGLLEYTPAAAATPALVRIAAVIDTLDVDTILERLSPSVHFASGYSLNGAPNMPKPTVSKPIYGSRLTQGMVNAATRESEKAKQRAVLSDETGGAIRNKPWQAFGNNNIYCNIKADKIVYRRLPLKDFQVVATVRKGQVEIPCSFTLFGGDVTVLSTGFTGTDALPVHITAKAQNVDMAAASTTLSDKYTVTGRGSLSIDIEGQGANYTELIHSLHGYANFSIPGGLVRGFSLIPPGLKGMKPIPASFPFDSISASAEIVDGVATSEDIVLESLILSAKGGGKILFAYGQVDLGLDFQIADKPPAIPISISGPYANLACTVDTKVLVRNTVQATKQLRIETAKSREETVQKLLRDAGGLLFR